MLLWCCSPIVSSLSNDLGAYDGLAVVLTHFVWWGIPYLLGRAYLTDASELRELAVAMVKFSVIYVPLIVFENRMSATLHLRLYGFTSGGSDNYAAFGPLGWRPSVFMQNGLALTFFMGSCALLAVSLWVSGWNRRIWGIALGPIIVALLVSTILCKCLGANLLTFTGIAVLLLSRKFHLPVLLYCLIAVAPLYMVLRATGVLDGRKLIALTEATATQQRADSLATRMVNEDRLVAKAMERPVFGWGGWGRARVRDESGKDITLTDGLWVIAIGQQGIFGLIALYLTFLLPCFLLVRRHDGGLTDAAVAPLMVFVVIVSLYAIDNLFNAMLNPLFLLATGGLTSLCERGVRSVFPRSRFQASHLNPSACPPLQPDRVGTSRRLRAIA